MAESIHVVGKTTVGWGGTTLGQTDENNDISIQIFKGEKIIHTNLSGPNLPAKIINLGEWARIRIPLISYDDTVIDTLVARGFTLGTIGTLGTDIPLTSMTITPTITGQYAYTFPKSRIIDNFEITKWGYEALRYMLIIEAIPDPAALATATTAIYTKTAV